MDAEINFLPWREQRRIRAQRTFLIRGAATVIVIALSVTGVEWFYRQQTAAQQLGLQRLLRQADQLADYRSRRQAWDRKHAALNTQHHALRAWMDQRHDSARIMHRLPVLVPQGVFVDRLIRQGSAIQLRGITISSGALEQLVTNLTRAADISAVSMRSISAPEHRFDRMYQPFELSWQWTLTERGKWQ